MEVITISLVIGLIVALGKLYTLSQKFHTLKLSYRYLEQDHEEIRGIAFTNESPEKKIQELMFKFDNLPF